MSEAVLADAQFSVARVFRPFEGFEDVYEGKPVRQPIAIPGNLDQDASKDGFDPNLISGIPVPFGSKIMLWIPTIFQDTGGGDFLVVPYRYQFIWRLRNLRDFKERRAAYHFTRESPGAGSPPEFVVPAAQKGVIFEGPKLTLNTSPPTSQFAMTDEVFADHEVVNERLTFPSLVTLPPLTPSGVNASYEQGVATLPGSDSNETALFNSIQLDAEGDELLIMVDLRDDDDSKTWNFAANQSDGGFSQFYGTGSGAIIRDLGIYVFTGSNP